MAMYLLLGLAALVATAYIYGLLARRSPGSPSHVLPVTPLGTALDRAIEPLLAEHPGESGLMLITNSMHALAVRAAAARKAERSLDLQYYYWKDDLSGGLLAREVVAAADRGVRVRVLIDDINSKGQDKNYLALDRHANIEVRLFNPMRCRNNPLLRAIDMVLHFWSVNRRMHNKAWIADGRIAVVGGRNIGDAYFDAAESSNFRDMDLAVIGPAVDQASAIFDAYWNSPVVFPIRTMGVSKKSDLKRLRQRLERLAETASARTYVERIAAGLGVDQVETAEAQMHWTNTARIVSDPPEKVYAGGAEEWLLKNILPVLRGAKSSIDITSPYFIPGAGGADLLARAVGDGVKVSVLTNSLAATDVAAVHGAYVRYRKPLVADGVKVFELKPRDDDGASMSLFGSKGASLHTKAFLVDQMSGFVGSFNFDPRSATLNTEMGILFDHPDLASELRSVFADETSAKRSYRIILAEGSVRWRDGDQSDATILDYEPEASIFRRFVARVIGMLPVESQL